MKAKDGEMMMQRSHHADAEKDDIEDDDSSTTSTEASSTAAADTSIDECTHSIPLDAPTTSPLAITTPSTLAILVVILSGVAATNPSIVTSCGEVVTSFFTWYLATLEAAPLFTKCVTGGLLATVGDYGAQWFEYKSHDDQKQHPKHDYSSTLQNINSLLSIHGLYDYRRGRAIALESFFVSCPLQHYAYDLFESILPVEGGSELYRSFAAMVHVFLDCVALDSIFVASGILVGGIFEGRSVTNYVLPNLKRTYLAALRAALMIDLSFSPVEFLSFRFLPLRLRVLSVNAVDLVWNGVVSFASHGTVEL